MFRNTLVRLYSSWGDRLKVLLMPRSDANQLPFNLTERDCILACNRRSIVSRDVTDYLKRVPSRSNQGNLVRLKRRHKCFYNCLKISLLAQRVVDFYACLMRYLCWDWDMRMVRRGTGERGRRRKGGRRLNNTSAAARRVSSNFSSRFSRSKRGSLAPIKT